MMDSKIVKLSVLALILTLLNLPALGVQNPVFQDSFEDGNFTDSWTIQRNHRTAFGRITDKFAREGDKSMRVHIGKTYHGDFDFKKNISQFKGFKKNLSFWLRPASNNVKAGYGFTGPGSYMKVKFDAQGGLRFMYVDDRGNWNTKWLDAYDPDVWYKVSLSVNPNKNTSTFHISGENGREEKVGPVTTKPYFPTLGFGVGDIGGPTDLYLDDVVLESAGRRTSSSTESPEPAPNNSVLVVEPEWEKALKASSVQKPLLVTSEYGRKFREFVNKSDPKKVYSLGEIEGSTEINVSNMKSDHIVPVFFPNATEAVSLDSERREHALKAAQYAHKRGLPVVSEDRQNLDVVELSEEELEESYLSETTEDVNHVVLANSNSPSSALAPRYASRRGAYLAVDGGPDKTPEEFRTTLKNSLNDLEQFGEGTESVDYLKEGMYLTLFGVPHKKLEDPVAEIDRPSSSSGGAKEFHSDLFYTDLNKDGRADLSYGRMPESIEEASKMLKTDSDGGDALVVGEYGRSAWPQVLMYRGGGMWSAKEMRSVFENQGLDAKLLAEKRVSRSDTRQAITKLPFHLLGFPDPEKAVGAIDKMKNNLIEGKFQRSVRTMVNNAPSLAKLAATKSDKVAKYTGGLVSSSAVKNVFSKTSLALFRALAVKDATRLLQTYVENDVDPDRKTLKKVLSKDALENPAGTFVEAVHTSLDPYPELNASSLSSEASSSDKVYFVGVSNSSHWILPNKQGDRLELSGSDGLFNQYNGSRNYKPSNISGFVYDGSDGATAPDGTYREVVSGGAEGVLGFTDETYFTHSEDIGRGFFQKGFTRGKALKKAINDFVQSGWSFDAEAVARGAAGASLDSNPAAPAERIYKTARRSYERYNRKRAKTYKSAVMYGEPEEKKDPKVKDYKTPARNCGADYCNYTWSLETNYRNSDGVLLMDKDLESIQVPRLPDLFFHKVERTFPEDAEIEVSADIRNTSFVEEENRIEGELPKNLLKKNIYTLPDGRQKLVIKHMALQYTDRGVRVFDRLDLKARVKQDMRANISTRQEPNSTVETITTAVQSSINRTGRIAVTVANQTWKTTRTAAVNFTAGSNTFSWEFDLEPGRYRASVVVDSEERLGPISRDFRVKELANPSVELEVKEKVEEGERFDAVIRASNKGGLPAEIDLGLEGSEAVQPDFFESRKLTLNLSGGEKVRREVKMRAFRPGNSSIKLVSNIGNDSEDFGVEPKSFVDRAISSVKYVFSDRRWFEDFEAETKSEGIILSLERPDASLDVEKTPEKSSYHLYRDGTTIRLEKTPSREKTILKSPEGKVEILRGRSGRKTAKKGEVSIKEAEEMREVLKRESRRLLNRYYLERGSLPGVSILEVIDRWV